MANIKTLIDYNRKDATLHGGQVDTVIPEHFKEQYPQLVKLLEAYYDYLDSDGQFGYRINNLFNTKDIDEADSDIRNLLFQERVPGLTADQFPAPSYSYKLLPGFYKAKGTNFSVDGFFRYFYLTDVERTLPRNNMFTIGSSEIGPQSLQYIQDSYFYQIYSILLKTSTPPNAYAAFYKNFLHPAGYAAFYETAFEDVATIPFQATTNVTSLGLDQFLAFNVVEAVGSLGIGGSGSVTHTDSSLDRRFFADKSFNFYDEYNKAYYEKSEGILADSPYNGQYISIADLLDPNSPRWSSDIDSSETVFNMSDSTGGALRDFSDSGQDSGTFDTVAPFPGIKFSNALETFDEDEFQFFDPYIYPDSAAALADSVPV